MTAAGQVVPYTFTVTNTGNVTLTGITVSDPKCTAAPTLSSGDTNADAKLQRTETWVYGCSHTVTQAEVDAGGNLLEHGHRRLRGVGAGDEHAATSRSPSRRRSHVVKSSTTVSVTAAGQVVPYTFTVTNTGNVTLTGITISDPKCGAAPTLVERRHERGLEAAAHRDLGLQLLAHGDAGGDGRGREPVATRSRSTPTESAPATSTLNIPIVQSPAIAVVKSSTTASITTAGQVVPYTFTVTNTGNVTLTGITVSDPKCGAAPVLSAGDANADWRSCSWRRRGCTAARTR